MKFWVSTCALAAILTFSGCNQSGDIAPQDRPNATVMMRDGTQVSGALVSNTGAQITIASADGKTQIIPMKEVKRVEYSDPPAPVSVAPTTSGTAATSTPGSAANAPAAVPALPPAPATDAIHEEHFHPVRAAIRTRTYTVGVGTELSVRTEETIDSKVAAEGQTYPAEVTRDVLDVEGAVVVPHGSNAVIVIRSASKGGKIRGASDLVLDLASISVDGQEYALSTTDLQQKGRDGVGANRRTAEFSGGGAAIGAIIGAIAGGGKGAAIGAGSGAGAGALTQIVTKGAAIRIPVESVLTFRLDAPLRVVAAN